MKVNKTQLSKIMAGAGPVIIDMYLPIINKALEEFKITSVRGIAHFLAEMNVETGSLSRMTESLMYSTPERLMMVWPSRFKTREMALPFVRSPEKLANFVYAGRMGNGTMESGDGWRYRGSGGFQITGKKNQLVCAEYFGIQPSKIGDWLRSPEGAIRSAAWFFVTSGALAQAELGKTDKVADIINLGHMTEKIGDAVGYTERLYSTNRALNTMERDFDIAA